MKNVILNNAIKLIKENKNFSDEKLLEIRYGLESIYLTITKFIIILILSIFFKITKEFLIFTIFYNIIRLFAFGMHAPSGKICLILSSIVFLLFPYLATILPANIYINCLLGITATILVIIYAPADTHKRPIIKRRNRYKTLSIIIALIYVYASLIIKDSFIANCLTFSLVVEVVLILPITYRLFKLPYGNYKLYFKRGFQ